MINQVGGNGGGIFRRMYGNFLKQCAQKTGIISLENFGESFTGLGNDWDIIGNLFLDAFNKTDRSLMDEIAGRIEKIYVQEKKCLEGLNNEVS